MSHLPRFTNAGKALQLRALDGERIIFTKIQIGQGELGDTSVRNLTQLIDPKATIPINSIKVDDGYAAVRGYFKNSAITEGFYYRELGLFAQDPDDPTKEILYCYSNTGDKSSYIAETSSALIERSIKIIAVVDDAENVSAHINGSAVYPDFTDLEEAIKEHNDDIEAHLGIVEKELEVYIDSNTVEDASLRDGTKEHPYQNIDEAILNLPYTVRYYSMHLKRGGKYTGAYEYLNGYYSSLKVLDISCYGVSGNVPVVTGLISVECVDEVNISNIEFIPEEDDYTHWGVSLNLMSCDNCACYDVTARYDTLGYGTFAEVYRSKLLLQSVQIYDAELAVNAYDGSEISIYGGSKLECDAILYVDASNAYIRDDIDGTIEATTTSLVLTKEMIEKLSDGTFLDHIESTANPHHVDLTQAQEQGGKIDVAHGGTGQTKFANGGLLVGKGDSAIGSVSGKGVVCSITENSPGYQEKLPVSLGGTGQNVFVPGRLVTSGSAANAPLESLEAAKGALFFQDGSYQHGILPVELGGTGTDEIYYNWYESDTVLNTYKARHLQFIVPGTDILVWTGRILVTAGSEFNCYLSWSGDKEFIDDKYALILSNADISEADVTRYANRFHVESQLVGDRVVTFIAIGRVAE